MKKNYSIKTRRTNRITALLTFVFVFGTLLAAQAQQETGDVTKAGNVVPGTTSVGGAVKLIDNKGTIKYLQTQNGLTILSNTTSDVTTTTVQLGGTLTDATYIDVAGNAFAFDGIDLIDTTTESVSTNSVTDDVAKGGNATGTGYTLLARDEATGAVRKLKIGDLDVVGANQSFTSTPSQVAYALTNTPKLTLFKTQVYRNGAKLIAGTDYEVATVVGTVTLKPLTFAVYAGDIIEVHYLN